MIKIFTNSIFDSKLISKIYKIFKILGINKLNKPTLKWLTNVINIRETFFSP